MSNTNHALINSSGNIPQEHCELAAQPLAHPGRRSVCPSALPCPVPFPLHFVHHSRMPSSFPHYSRKSVQAAGTQHHTNTSLG